jgi:hypothetical protein
MEAFFIIFIRLALHGMLISAENAGNRVAVKTSIVNTT